MIFVDIKTYFKIKIDYKKQHNKIIFFKTILTKINTFETIKKYYKNF